MFMGHYGPGLVAKCCNKSIPLWLLLLAGQFVDVFWSIFVLLGIEKLRLVPHFTATNAFDNYYMPFTHGLMGAIFWSLVAMVAYKSVPRFRGTWPAAVLIAAIVFSHWLLDLVVHTHDLPLYLNEAKVGLGLWNHRLAAYLLEVAMVLVGTVLYVRATKPTTAAGRWAIWLLCALFIGVQTISVYGPAPTTPAKVALTCLVAYLVATAATFWVERQRA